MIAPPGMPTLLHPDDPAFHRMVAAFEGEPEEWLAVNRGLRDAMASYAAHRSPYYREVIRPGALFEEIPILTKEIVRTRHDDLLAEGVHRDRWAPDRTSGSSGRPVAFIRDTAQGPLENLSGRRFLQWLNGIPPQATTVWVAARPAGDPNPPPRGPRRLLGRQSDPDVHAVRIFGFTPKHVRREVARWNRFRQWFLYGHASALAWVADQVASQRLPLPNPPVCVVTTSDTLTPDAAHRIGGSLGVPVHSWYGSAELNGFVGGTLPGSRRYVVNPLLVWCEVLADSGQPAVPGETGRLVLTDLNNLVMPFIRYDTGDLAAASSQTIGGFPVLEDLLGRQSEALRLPSGKVLSGATVGAALFVIRDFVEDVRAYQCARVGGNELELRVVWARPPSWEREIAMAETVRSVADPDTAVTVRAVEELERLPSGKAWILRDEWSLPSP
jgi:phenylacetate-CoA ligase